MEHIGLFVQRNDIVEEVSPDGSSQVKKLCQDVEQIQRGVIRTNCVDCLDRTNVAQQMICLETLIRLVPGMQ